MMQGQRSSMFRSEALEHYIQSRERGILPRITTPPVFLCFWILLSLCISAGVLAYLSQVPVYVNGSGIVLEQGTSVLVFIPTSPAHPVRIHVGAPAYLHIAASPLTVNGTIDQVEAHLLSPGDAQKRYGLQGKVPQIITGPSIVAWLKLETTFPLQSYAGSIISVQVQAGTVRVISLLLGSSLPDGE